MRAVHGRGLVRPPVVRVLGIVGQPLLCVSMALLKVRRHHLKPWLNRLPRENWRS